MIAASEELLLYTGQLFPIYDEHERLVVDGPGDLLFDHTTFPAKIHGLGNLT